jgi:2-polyprenyl-3-methyl-5-hydroxy-6-metoxy-1,4-benzoquinol methylase
MPENDFQNANEETREAWEANAEVWDAKMGDEGNDFVTILQWPAISEFLGVENVVEGRSQTSLQHQPHILDIACGNGLFSRKLADLGATVTAFDFSANLIELAKKRWANYASQITFHALDATDEAALLSLGEHTFDAALCNMALFDIADIAPLFHMLPKMLKPGGCFVFSLMHPAFNNSSCVHVGEEMDDNGQIKAVYSVKISRYMTPYQAHGVALRNQPKPQLYFERPIQYYLNLGFRNGFVLDGFAERAFPPEHQPNHPLSWGGQFSEIPPVLVVRLRLP